MVHEASSHQVPSENIIGSFMSRHKTSFDKSSSCCVGLLASDIHTALFVTVFFSFSMFGTSKAQIGAWLVKISVTIFLNIKSRAEHIFTSNSYPQPSDVQLDSSSFLHTNIVKVDIIAGNCRALRRTFGISS